MKLVYPLVQGPKLILTFCLWKKKLKVLMWHCFFSFFFCCTSVLKAERTWAIPGCNINLHAKKKLPLGCAKCFFLVLLLAEKYKSITFFWSSMDLYGCNLSMFLKLMKQPILQACICGKHIKCFINYAISDKTRQIKCGKLCFCHKNQRSIM